MYKASNNHLFNKILVTIIGLNLGLLIVGAVPAIYSPRFNCAQFVMPEGSFEAEIIATPSTTNWTASLNNDLKTWNCTVISATYGNINCNSMPGWKLSISVPADIPPELMQLNITSNEGSLSAMRAVSVVKNFDDDFYILHMSDQHVSHVKAAYANGTDDQKNGSQEALEWSTGPVNLINPRFVTVTGDNIHIYFSASSWSGFSEAQAKIDRYKKALVDFVVPMILINGNHDCGYNDYVDVIAWRKMYEEQIGPRVYERRLGNFYVLGNEWTCTDYLDWAKKRWAAAQADATIGYRLYLMHYTSTPLGNYTHIPTATNPADLMLVGHGHATKTLATSPYYTLEAPSMHNYYMAPFYNFVKTGEMWNCPSKATHGTNNIQPLFDDWGAPRVASTYTNVNDGTNTSNTVTITNKNNINYYDGRVRFLMKNGTYNIAGGTKLAEYSYGNNMTAVLVKVDIKAGTPSSPSSNVVTISPVSSATTSPIFNEIKVRVIPNPSFNTITVMMDDVKNEHVTIEVIALNGTSVYSAELQNKPQHTIDLSAYGKGVYVVNTTCKGMVFKNIVVLN